MVEDGMIERFGRWMVGYLLDRNLVKIESK